MTTEYIWIVKKADEESNSYVTIEAFFTKEEASNRIEDFQRLFPTVFIVTPVPINKASLTKYKESVSKPEVN